MVTNPIVDILNHYYFAQKAKYDAMAVPGVLPKPGNRAGELLIR